MKKSTTIKSCDKLYKKSVQQSIIDENEYKSLSNVTKNDFFS